MNEYQLICCDMQRNYKIYYGHGRVVQSEDNNHLHYDGELTLTYFIRCNGKVRIEGNNYRIMDGDMVIMNPREIHCRWIEKGSLLELVSIHISRALVEAFPFDGELLFDRFCRRKGGEGNRIDAETVRRQGLDTLAQSILSASKEHTDHARILTTCKLVELLIRLMDAPSAELSSVSGGNSGNALVDATLRYIETHYREDISCTLIAEQLYVSRYRLEHLFKEVVGVSLWEYVILKRIICFHDFVGRHNSVAEAARLAGFRNYANFYRLYKKRMNRSPTEYKKQLEEWQHEIRKDELLP